MHVYLLWQIHQVVTIDGKRHINHCNHFGNCAAGRVWSCFINLVLWITIFIKGIDDLLSYVDNDFSWELELNLSWYEPYKSLFHPNRQLCFVFGINWASLRKTKTGLWLSTHHYWS
jgi:hypothetical protein